MIQHLKQVYWFLLLGLAACGQKESNTTPETGQPVYGRIVALSGAITETLFALGMGDKVVGIDITSTYPETVAQLSQLGHVSQLNTEAILGLHPDLILAEATDSSRQQLQHLRQAGIKIQFIPNTYTLESPLQMANNLSSLLGSSQKLEELKSTNAAYRNKLSKFIGQQQYSPKVLFIYARGSGSLMVAGKNTPAAAMIELAGGRNAITQFEGFKALSAEGLIETQPDVLLLFESGLKSLDGETGLLQIPGLAKTPAGQNRRFIAMDGLYLLGFTPRAAAAALELATRLHSFDYDNLLTKKTSDFE